MKAQIRRFDAKKVRNFCEHPRKMLKKCDNYVVHIQFLSKSSKNRKFWRQQTTQNLQYTERKILNDNIFLQNLNFRKLCKPPAPAIKSKIYIDVKFGVLLWGS
jgi:hypothetical protein